MKIIRYIFPVILLFSAQMLFAELYVWTDASGNKHISSTPPPKSEVAGDCKSYETHPDPPKQKNQTSSNQSVSKKTPARQKQKYPPVKLYTTDWCGYCKKAKAWFEQEGVPYKDINVESAQENYDEFKKLGGTGYPLIFIGEKRMQGWSEGRARQYLGME